MRLFSTYHIDHDMTGIVAFVTRTVVFLALVVDLSSHIPVVVSPPCQVGLSPIETPSMTLSEALRGPRPITHHAMMSKKVTR